MGVGKHRKVWILVLGLASGFASTAWAATNAQSFNYQGRVMNAAGTRGLAEPVSLTFGIYDPSGTCLLYEETQSVDLTATHGMFSVQIGSSPGAGKRTTWSGGTPNSNSMAVVFSNSVIPPLVGVPAKVDPGCTANPYVPAATHARKLRVTVTPSSTGTPIVLSPDQVIGAAPQATTAETVQGKVPMDFLQVTGNSATRSLTDAELLQLIGGAASIGTTAADASSLHHHDSLYARTTYADTKLGSRDLDLTGLTNGQSIRWNSGSSKWEVYSPAAGGSVTNITAGTGLTGGSIAVSGTIGLASSGVTAGTYTRATVAVDATGRITSATNGSAIDLAADTTGTLSVAKGGTGLGSLGNNQTLTTNGSGVMTPVSAGSSGQVLVQNSTLAAPTFSFIANANIDPAAAIVDTKLATITSAGKVLGDAITSGTLAGSTAINTSGAITTTGTVSAAALKVTGGTLGSGKVLTSDGSGNATWQDPSGTSQWTTYSPNLSYTAGSVGIGTTAPGAHLEIRANSPQIRVMANVSSASMVLSKQSSSTTGAFLDFTTGGTSNFVLGTYGTNSDLIIGPLFTTPYLTIQRSNGYVGIGTTTAPGRLLDVNGPVRIAAGTLPASPVAGDIAIDSGASNALKWYNGTAWQTAGGTGGATNINGLSDAAFDTSKRSLVLGSKPTFGASDQYNTAVGYQALAANNGAGNNTAIGSSAASSNTTGTDNTALGSNAALYNTTGAGNTALGAQALLKNQTGSNTTAIGAYAASGNSLSTIISNSTVVGAQAGSPGTGGNHTLTSAVAIGYMAGTAYTASSLSLTNTSVIGTNALYGAGVTAADTVILGQSANSGMANSVSYTNSVILGNGFGKPSTSQTVSDTVSIGHLAGQNVTTANTNIFLGAQAGSTTTTGSGNILIGYQAYAPSATTSSFLNLGNTLYGDLSTGKIGIGTTSPSTQLEVNGGIKTASIQVTGGTPGLGKVLTSDANGNGTWQNAAGGGFTVDGKDNLKAGTNALTANTTSHYNVALGVNAAQNVEGSGVTGQNVAIGRDAMLAAVGSSGTNNTALGYRTLYSLSSGTDNVAVGPSAMYYNTTGVSNVAIGSGALQSNTDGSHNIAIGEAAARDMRASGTFAQNIALGNYALLGTGTASTGTYNFAAMRSAAQYITSGTHNVSIGMESMKYITSGSHNVALGYQAGYAGGAGTDVTTGSNNIFIGERTQTSLNSVTDAIAIGKLATVQGNNAIAIGQGTTAPANTVVLGNATTAATLLKGNVSIGTTSTPDTLTVYKAWNPSLKIDNAGLNAIRFSLGSWGNSLESSGDGGTPTDFTISVGNATSSNPERLRITGSNGYVGIGTTNPTYLLHLGVDSAAKPGTSTWTIASDVRLKDIRAPFTRGLAALEEIRPIYFRYKAGNPLQLPSDQEFVGIRAQDAQKSVPEAVQTDGQGYLHITNDAIIWTMLNSIKELYHRWADDHDALETMRRELAEKDRRTRELQEQVRDLQGRLERLEKSDARSRQE